MYLNCVWFFFVGLLICGSVITSKKPKILGEMHKKSFALLLIITWFTYFTIPFCHDVLFNISNNDVLSLCVCCVVCSKWSVCELTAAAEQLHYEAL